MRMPTVSVVADQSRTKISSLVSELVRLKCGAAGNIKSAIRDLSKETGISGAWLRRAWKASPGFAPLMHYYDSLCVALEVEVERQERRRVQRREFLEGLRRDAAAGGFRKMGMDALPPRA
jgi:hypothetical protein